MLRDFKIYVPTLNEERLIPYTLQALLNVFPAEQIEVLDLGSTDKTRRGIPSEIKTHGFRLPEGGEENPGKAGAFFTELKNEFSARQEWVLWVDGDEIYPISSLVKMKEWLHQAQSGEHNEKFVRLYWRILREREGKIWCSKEYLSAGAKLFNSNFQQFRRAWPREVTVQTDLSVPGPGKKKDFTGLWFWHGVLLQRSVVKEHTARYKKRLSKQGKYDSIMTWEKIRAFPWETGYDEEIVLPWTVFNMHTTGGLDTSWSGTELTV